MKASYIYGLIITGLLTIVSCNQDPIFYRISTETAPIPPLIEGAPTNMVVFKRKNADLLYVASGRLHWYKAARSSGSSWNSDTYRIEQPPGDRIISLAATQTYLYALCLSGHGVDTTLWRIGQSDNEWSSVGGAGSLVLQSIHADSGTGVLFVSAGIDTYSILCIDDSSSTLRSLRGGTSMLSGVVFRSGAFYLSTKGSGIFRVSSADGTSASGGTTQVSDANRIFMGIIRLEDNTVIAIERDGGTLYGENGGRFRPIAYSGAQEGTMASGSYATGAMAIWKCPSQSDARQGAKLLIVGIQGNLYNSAYSSYTHGYVEFNLKDGGSLDTGTFRNSAGNLQSVGHNDRYRASLGKHPVNHLFQAPSTIDGNRTFFAATQTAGLWSYRNRSDGWQWNAEN